MYIYICIYIYVYILVGGLEHFALFHSVGNFIIPNWRLLIFFRGIGMPPTSIYIYSTDRPIGFDLLGLLPPARWYINIFNIGQGVCEFNKNDGPSGVNAVRTRILRWVCPKTGTVFGEIFYLQGFVRMTRKDSGAPSLRKWERNNKPWDLLVPCCFWDQSTVHVLAESWYIQTLNVFCGSTACIPCRKAGWPMAWCDVSLFRWMCYQLVMTNSD